MTIKLIAAEYMWSASAVLIIFQREQSMTGNEPHSTISHLVTTAYKKHDT